MPATRPGWTPRGRPGRVVHDGSVSPNRRHVVVLDGALVPSRSLLRVEEALQDLLVAKCILPTLGLLVLLDCAQVPNLAHLSGRLDKLGPVLLILQILSLHSVHMLARMGLLLPELPRAQICPVEVVLGSPRVPCLEVGILLLLVACPRMHHQVVVLSHLAGTSSLDCVGHLTAPCLHGRIRQAVHLAFLLKQLPVVVVLLFPDGVNPVEIVHVLDGTGTALVHRHLGQ